METRSGKMVGIDSNGRIITVRASCLKMCLKNRRPKYVEPEVRELIGRCHRTRVRVKDVALELGVRLLTIRRILRKLESEGMIRRIRSESPGVAEETYEINRGSIYA